MGVSGKRGDGEAGNRGEERKSRGAAGRKQEAADRR
jgi:hypothetical protein